MLLNNGALNVALINGGTGFSGGGGGESGGSTFVRFIDSAELARITEGVAYSVFAQVKIADPAGVMRNYRNRNNINWIHSLEYDQSIDAPIATATVRLWRAVGGRSLAPLKTGSSYNDIPFIQADLSSETGPSLDAGRRIIIETASVPLGSVPTNDDWRSVFEGYVDDVDWAQNPVVLTARDLAAPLVDTWFPLPNTLPEGANIQTNLNLVLELAHLDVAMTVYVPALPDPEVILGGYKYDIEPVIDSLLRLSQLIGWDLRMRWSDVDQAWRLTFKDPGRYRTDSDYTLTPAMYIDVKTFKIDRTPIRNDFALSYRPGNDTGVDRVTAYDYDPESVRRYGRRSMVLQESDDSPINGGDAAALMLALIKYDLADPFADKVIEMPYFWPLEVHNIINFPANLVHSDVPLNLACVAVKHVLGKDQTRTIGTFRGRPAGSYWGWLKRRPIGVRPIDPDGEGPAPSGFSGLRQTPNYTTDTVTFDWTYVGNPSAEFDVYAQVRLGTGTGGGLALVGSTGVGVMTFEYDLGTINIEPVSNPAATAVVSFYIKARLVTTLLAISGTSTEYYPIPSSEILIDP